MTKKFNITGNSKITDFLLATKYAGMTPNEEVLLLRFMLKESMGIVDIYDAVDIGKTSVNSALHELVRKGYIIKEERRHEKGYRLPYKYHLASERIQNGKKKARQEEPTQEDEESPPVEMKHTENENRCKGGFFHVQTYSKDKNPVIENLKLDFECLGKELVDESPSMDFKKLDETCSQSGFDALSSSPAENSETEQPYNINRFYKKKERKNNIFFLSLSFSEKQENREKEIKKQIGYDNICKNNKEAKAILDNIVGILHDVKHRNLKQVYIGGQTMSQRLVRNRYEKLGQAEVESVVAAFFDNQHNIRYLRSWLQTCLYNAKPSPFGSKSSPCTGYSRNESRWNGGKRQKAAIATGGSSLPSTELNQYLQSLFR